MCTCRQTDEAEVSVGYCVSCGDSCPRPTHDQIEQLQSKVNELEDLLRAASAGQSANTTEALRTWRQSDSTNAHASSSRSLNPHASIDEPASDEGNDDAGAAFNTPSGDQYIYDTTG